MSSKEDTSSSGVVVLFNWRWQCHYILDNIKHMFYNNRIAIKHARAREGSVGLWITAMRKITKIS